MIYRPQAMRFKPRARTLSLPEFSLSAEATKSATDVQTSNLRCSLNPTRVAFLARSQQGELHQRKRRIPDPKTVSNPPASPQAPG